MNREILFRGKPTLKQFGEWVTGHYLKDLENGQIRHYIFNCPLQIEVNPETVGQYLSLCDKNNKKAFVGDIFKDGRGVIRTIFNVPAGFAFESNPVSFGHGYQNGINPYEAFSDRQNASWFFQNCEIIGNIHDNPKLLIR